MNDKSYKNIPKRVLIVLKMDKKQTAVEWLFEKISDLLIDYSEGNISALYYGIKATEYKHHAKQMEKEQMQKLIIWMYKVSADQPMRFETDIDDIVEQYYNETYGK